MSASAAAIPPAAGSRGCTGTGGPNAAGASAASRPRPPSSCSWPCWPRCWRRRPHPPRCCRWPGWASSWWPRSWSGSGAARPRTCSGCGCGSGGRDAAAGPGCRPGCSPTTPAPRDLPGVLAPLRPLDIDDGRGRRHVLLHNRRTGTLTAILRCAPIGLDLADPDQADQWVAAWGGFLADLGYQPLVRHIAVTVDTAPTGGDALATHVATHLDPGAPRLARQVLSELVADTTARTASVQVWLSVCLDPNRATPKPADLLAACVEVGRWLPGLETELAGCGVAVQGRATLTWLACGGAGRVRPRRPTPPGRGRAGVGGRGPGRRPRGMGPLPPRERGLGQLGVAGGTTPSRRRRGPGPAGGARPVCAAGVLAVSALPRRPSGSQGRSPGHRRTDPPRLGRPHPAG